jgi:hypothetical protein
MQVLIARAVLAGLFVSSWSREVSARRGRPRISGRAGTSVPLDECAAHSIWPKPAEMTCGGVDREPLVVDAALSIEFAPESAVQSSPRLEAAFARTLEKISLTPLRRTRGIQAPQFTFPGDDDDDDGAPPTLRATASNSSTSTSSTLTLVLVEVKAALPPEPDGGEANPQLNDDESYTLEVAKDESGGSPSARVVAPTAWGALRGLETLAQLVHQVDLDAGCWAGDAPLFPWRTAAAASGGAGGRPLLVIPAAPLAVADAPRYPWRGVLLDTANHFLPVGALEQFVDAMAAVKMNVLHWHLVDSYAFSFAAPSAPGLAEHGSWQYPSAAYQPVDVARVVAFAADRGVRVVPEFDVPGHAFSWGLDPKEKAPGLTAACPRYVDGLGHVDDVPLDPTEPRVYEVLSALLGDASSAFPDGHFHWGGDELKVGLPERSAGATPPPRALAGAH